MEPVSSQRSHSRRDRQHKITVSVRFQCQTIPARWTVGPKGALVYVPSATGVIEINPWKIREKFLALPKDDERLVGFLNEVGSWDFNPSCKTQDYWEWQDILKIALSNLKNWKERVSPLDPKKVRRLSCIPRHDIGLEPEGQFKDAVFSCANRSVLDAIIASIRFDESKRLRRRRSPIGETAKKSNARGAGIRGKKGK